jgi:hypothetical protein
MCVRIKRWEQLADALYSASSRIVWRLERTGEESGLEE